MRAALIFLGADLGLLAIYVILVLVARGVRHRRHERAELRQLYREVQRHVEEEDAWRTR